MVAAIFGRPKALIGMVHLLPLPGSPRFGGDLEAVIAAAVEDARALEAGGMDALLVENYGDAPFTPGAVDPATVAAMAAALRAVRAAVRIPHGVSVLKNDARSALALAAVTGGRFVRVNIHAGVRVTDQGIIQGDAYTSLRYRRALGADVVILADLQGKHGYPLAPVDLEQEARDFCYRGLADALVVSGRGTGEAADLELVKRVREAVPDRPILVGSGARPESVADILALADGVIVGTGLKREGAIDRPVDPERVRRLVEAAARARP
jgi:membrane complex biogenesis BtpA family protein